MAKTTSSLVNTYSTSSRSLGVHTLAHTKSKHTSPRPEDLTTLAHDMHELEKVDWLKKSTWPAGNIQICSEAKRNRQLHDSNMRSLRN